MPGSPRPAAVRPGSVPGSPRPAAASKALPKGDAELRAEEGVREATAEAVQAARHGEFEGAPTSFETLVELFRTAPESESGALEFAYVRRAASGGPYDLDLVPFQEVQWGDYTTLSQRGFTQYEDGNPSEFIPLERWLDERFYHRRISALPFFKDFPRRKAFHLWKDAGNRGRMTKAGAVLQERLFLLHPQFRPLLLQVRALCLELSDLRLVHGKMARSCGLEEFQAQQKKLQREAARSVKGMAHRILQDVRGTFGSILDGLRREVLARDAAQAGDSSAAAKNRSGQGVHVQVRVDREALEILGFPGDTGFGARSALRKECSRFMRFAYFVDLLAMTALSESTQGSFDDVVCGLTGAESLPRLPPADSLSRRGSQARQVSGLKRSMSRVSQASSGSPTNRAGSLPGSPTNRRVGFHRQTSTALSETVDAGLLVLPVDAGLPAAEAPRERAWGLVFRVQAVLGHVVDSSEDVQLMPCSQEWQDELISVVCGGFELMDTFDKLATHPTLEPYRRILSTVKDRIEGKVTEQDGESVEVSFRYELEQSWPWRRNLVLLRASLDDAFADATRELRFLHVHIGRSHRCKVEDVHHALNSAVERGKVRDLTGLHEGYKADLAEIQELPEQMVYAALQVEILSIRQKLTAAPKRCLYQLQELLPDTVVKLSVGLSEWMRMKQQLLEPSPESIAVYVEQFRFLEEIGFEVLGRAVQLKSMRDICELVEAHKISMTDQTRKMAITTGRDFDEFRQVIAAKELSIMRLKDGITDELNVLCEAAAAEAYAMMGEVSEAYLLTLVTALGEYGPDEPPPSEAIMAAGKVPPLLSPQRSRKLWVADEDGSMKVAVLEGLRKRWEELHRRWELHTGHQDALGYDKAQCSELVRLETEIGCRLAIWETMHAWRASAGAWAMTPVVQIEVDEVLGTVGKLANAVLKVKADGRLPKTPVLGELRCGFVLVQDAMTVIRALQNPHLQPRHWELIVPARDPSSLLVGDAIEMYQSGQGTMILSVATTATQESYIDVALQNVEARFSSLAFALVPYKDRRDQNVLGPTEPIAAHLEDASIIYYNIYDIL